MAMDQPLEEGKNMSFLDHIDELRSHLIRSIIAILIGGIIAFTYIKEIVGDIIFGPTKSDFISYRLMCDLGHALKRGDVLCIGDFPFIIQNFGVTTQFLQAFKIAAIAGVIMAFPYILYQIWRFIKPALSAKEQKHTTGFVFFCSSLFFLGLSFGYFILAPISMNFLGNFSLGDDIQNQFSLQSVVGFITTMSFGTGLIFELPVLIYFLAKMGLITPAFLKKYRKHSFVIILILSAFVTPPDVVSQILLTIPLYLLFEFGIIIAKKVYKDREKADKERAARV